MIWSQTFPCFAKNNRTPAAINRAAMAMSAPSRILYGHDGQSISPDIMIVFHQFKADEKPFNTAEVLPMDMNPSEDSQAVFTRIADQSLSYWFNRPDFRASPIGRTATEVEENVQQEVILSKSEKYQHKLNFSIQAFQATAKIQYTGFTNMAVRYQAADNSTNVEMSEALSKNSELVLGHTARPTDRLSQVALHYSF